MPYAAPVACSKCRKPKPQCTCKRPSVTKLGYGRRWQRYRLLFLQDHPLCSDPSHGDRPVAATEVDHVEPHRGDHEKFWDPGNHQALCKPCHSRKTAREVGWTNR